MTDKRLYIHEARLVADSNFAAVGSPSRGDPGPYQTEITTHSSSPYLTPAPIKDRPRQAIVYLCLGYAAKWKERLISTKH